MFEDKRIKVIGDSKEKDAIILACEKGVGLTIVSPDRKKYIICLNLESSPIYREEVIDNGWNKKEQKEILVLLNKIFDRMVIEIEEGSKIDTSEGSAIRDLTIVLGYKIGRSGDSTNGESCAFGQ